MDGHQPSLSIRDLYARLGTAAAPLVIDVRRMPAFDKADSLIASAIHRAPNDVEQWRHELPANRQVVAYCVHGHEVSQGVTAALRAAGVDAVYLEGGIEAWLAAQLPTSRKRGPDAGKWVTREHPKIDRIACPWLVSRYGRRFDLCSARQHRRHASFDPNHVSLPS